MAHKVPQKVLAHELAVSQSTISRMLRGKAKLQFGQVQQLARFFKVPFHTFHTEDAVLPHITITFNHDSVVVPVPVEGEGLAPLPGA